MTFASPGRRWLGRQPTVGAAGILAIRHAFKGENAAVQIATHLAILSIGDCRTRRAAVAWVLMRADLCAVGCVCRVHQRRARCCGKGKGSTAAEGNAVLAHDFPPRLFSSG